MLMREVISSRDMRARPARVLDRVAVQFQVAFTPLCAVAMCRRRRSQDPS